MFLGVSQARHTLFRQLHRWLQLIGYGSLPVISSSCRTVVSPGRELRHRLVPPLAGGDQLADMFTVPDTHPTLQPALFLSRRSPLPRPPWPLSMLPVRSERGSNLRDQHARLRAGGHAGKRAAPACSIASSCWSAEITAEHRIDKRSMSPLSPSAESASSASAVASHRLPAARHRDRARSSHLPAIKGARSLPQRSAIRRAKIGRETQTQLRACACATAQPALVWRVAGEGQCAGE